MQVADLVLAPIVHASAASRDAIRLTAPKTTSRRLIRSPPITSSDCVPHHAVLIAPGRWVIDNMGMGAYVRLIESSKPTPTMKNVKPERAELLVTLATIRDNLAKFVESPAWDKP